MGIFRHFPYSNFHEMNLDWILEKVQDLTKEVHDFIINTESTIKNEVDNWLNDHPEATTTVQDGAITIQKLNNNLKMQIEQMPLSICRYGRILDAFGENNSSRTLYTQSVVYDEKNGRYFVAGSYDNDANQNINIYNEYGMLLSSHNYTLLGHAQGMALDNDGFLYINNHDVIVVIDTNTMDITRTIPIQTLSLINSVSIENGVMYVCGRTGNDPTLTYIAYDFATAAEKILFTIDLPKNIIVQSCLYHNNYFYHLYNRSNQIYKINAITGECECIYDVPTDDGYYYVGEAECLFLKNNKICLAGNGIYIVSTAHERAAFALLFETSLTGKLEGNNRGLYVENIFPRQITVDNTAAYTFNPYDIVTCADEVNIIKDVHYIYINNCNGGSIIARNRNISIIGTANKTTLEYVVMYGGTLILRNSIVNNLLYLTGCSAFIDASSITGNAYLNCSIIDSINTLYSNVTNFTGSLIRVNGLTQDNFALKMASGLATSNTKIEIYLDRISSWTTFYAKLLEVLTSYSTTKPLRISAEALVSNKLYTITLSPIVDQILNGVYNPTVNDKVFNLTPTAITYDNADAVLRQIKIIL